MKLLFIGDIVGEPGRRAVKALVPGLRERLGIDFVIANAENSAGGSGVSLGTAREIFEGGVDVITTGDHLWDNRDVSQLLANEPRFLRPANYPAGVPGRGGAVFRREGLPPVGVLNVQGRTFMAAHLENPFAVAESEVMRLRAETPIVFVDFHAEVTSEKIALGWFLDGRASAVVGTHTHVQTADERILPQGTACLTDAGFTGGHGGVLGRDWPPVIERFLRQTPQRFTVCESDIWLKGCLLEVDDHTGRATSIVRVSEPLP